MYAGLFSAPRHQFPAKVTQASESDLLQHPSLLLPGDQLTKKVLVCGTKYCAGLILVTKILSQDLLVVGVIQQIVVRAQQVHFLLTLHDAARNRFRYFESVPKNKVSLVCHDKLADYKPLVMRRSSEHFAFVLHHHLPSPL